MMIRKCQEKYRQRHINNRQRQDCIVNDRVKYRQRHLNNRHRQDCIVNDKTVSSTTRLCRHRQEIIGNDKILS